MSEALSGKVAIITGAAGGQGRVAARLFVEAGARVMLTDIDTDGTAIADALGDTACFHRHDICDRNDWDVVVAETIDRFGGIDILINNAGIAGHDSIATIEPDRLARYLDVNMQGALHGIQAVLPSMRARGGGAIVNIGSISGMKGFANLAGYGVSKWALRGLTRFAARDLAGDGIRVNLVMPGAVDVAMIRTGNPQAGKDAVAAQVPLGRVASAEEVMRTALFLASDAASYMTGAEMVVDGGLTS